MNRLAVGLVVVAVALAGRVVADQACATEQCENARRTPKLPADVRTFAEQRDGCDYFRGEPWPEGNTAAAGERRKFISKNLAKLCTGTDKRLKELRGKYRHNPAVVELLKGYEDAIEHR